jgi:hypothetical protein
VLENNGRKASGANEKAGNFSFVMAIAHANIHGSQTHKKQKVMKARTGGLIY